MQFFSFNQKHIARKYGYSKLIKLYEESEILLKRVAGTGNERDLSKAMERHREIEYALLYTYTPEYRSK